MRKPSESQTSTSNHSSKWPHFVIYAQQLTSVLKFLSVPTTVTDSIRRNLQLK
jgi:hypothetical protein